MIRRRREVRSRSARGLFKAREGSTAVEFAMVAAPFFFMMFCILELGVVFVVDSVLENAIYETSRLIRTGQAQAEGMTRDAFKASVCGRMGVFSSQCPARLNVDVRVLPRFSGNNLPEPADAASFPDQYQQGAAGSIVVVRAWYQQQLFTPFLNQALSRFGDGKATLTATTAFRNEPFGPVTP